MGDGPEEEVKLWPSAVCTDCGRPFPKDQDWAKKCFLCWKESRGYELTKGDKCFLWGQIELARIVEEVTKMQAHYRRVVQQMEQRNVPALSDQGIDPRLLRDVISLCHPDKHGDSPKATAITQELLALRAQMKT
jgi:hypothetical protein